MEYYSLTLEHSQKGIPDLDGSTEETPMCQTTTFWDGFALVLDPLFAFTLWPSSSSSVTPIVLIKKIDPFRCYSCKVAGAWLSIYSHLLSPFFSIHFSLKQTPRTLKSFCSFVIACWKFDFNMSPLGVQDSYKINGGSSWPLHRLPTNFGGLLTRFTTAPLNDVWLKISPSPNLLFMDKQNVSNVPIILYM